MQLLSGLWHSLRWDIVFLVPLVLFLGKYGWDFLLGEREAGGLKDFQTKDPFLTSPGFTLSWLERRLGPPVVVLVVLSIILILAGEFALFHMKTIVAGLLLMAVSAYWGVRKKSTLRPFHKEPFQRGDWIVIFSLIAAGLLFNKPAEYILNYRDPGAYSNIAAWIVQKGAIRGINADYIGFDAPEKQALFLPVSLTVAPFPKPYECFWISNPQTGMMTPNYFSLLPLWLALFYKVGGLAALFRFNIFPGLVSVLAIATLGRRLFFSTFPGWLAGILLAFNLGQLWFCRGPYSEILTQTLILCGLWMLSLAMEYGRVRLFFFAGIIFSLTLFARSDSFLVIFSLGLAGFFLCALQKEPSQKSPSHMKMFLWGMVPLSVWAVAHMLYFSAFYLWTALDAVVKTSHRWELAAVLMTTLVLLGLAWGWRKKIRGCLAVASERQKRWAWGGVVFFAAIILFGYFVRPHLPPSVYQPTNSFYDRASFRMYDELNWVRLGWYLTPPGIVLACVGFLMLLPRFFQKEWRHLIPFLCFVWVFGTFYLFKSRAMPDNYWVIRRYLEVIIPAALLLAGFCLAQIGAVRIKAVPSMVKQGLCGCLVFLLVGWTFVQTLKVAPLQEMSGSVQQLARIAEKTTKFDILLMEDGNFKYFLSAPLKFFFYKTVYIFAHSELDGNSFDRLLDQWNGQGRRVGLLTSEEHSRLFSRKYQFLPFGEMVFRTRILETPVDRLPGGLQDLTLPIQFYEVQPVLKPGRAAYEWALGQNFGVKTEGFYQTEKESDGTIFRWAGSQATISLPSFEGKGDMQLIMTLSRPVPSRVPAAACRISLNGHLLQEAIPGSTPQVFQTVFPREFVSSSTIVNQLLLETPAFSPSRLGVSPDVRELGVKVYSVRLEPVAGKSSH
jgi:hypothetical protein